jgi:hypothetical protein
MLISPNEYRLICTFATPRPRAGQAVPWMKTPHGSGRILPLLVLL